MHYSVFFSVTITTRIKSKYYLLLSILDFYNSTSSISTRSQLLHLNLITLFPQVTQCFTSIHLRTLEVLPHLHVFEQLKTILLLVTSQSKTTVSLHVCIYMSLVHDTQNSLGKYRIGSIHIVYLP